MKRILTNNIVENTRRQPFNKDSYDHLQEAFKEVFADILKGLTNEAAGVVVLWGIVDSDSDPDDYNLSAGAVLYNGEVFSVPAFVGSDASDVPVLNIVSTFRPGDPVKFSDNNDFNVHEIRTMAWTMDTSGSGIVDFEDLKRLKDVLKPASFQTGNNARILIPMIIDIGTWNMTTDFQIDVPLPAGFDYKKVKGPFGVTIRNDANNARYPLMSALYPGGDGDGRMGGGVTQVTSLGFTLTRTRDTGGADSGIFAIGGFSNTSGGYNRGDITFYYEP